jgi:hypothetical protein
MKSLILAMLVAGCMTMANPQASHGSTRTTIAIPGDIICTVGNQAAVQAQLLEATGLAVPGETIVFHVDTGHGLHMVGQGVTNSDGWATAEFTAYYDGAKMKGNMTRARIRAQFDGSREFKRAVASGWITLTLAPGSGVEAAEAAPGRRDDEPEYPSSEPEDTDDSEAPDSADSGSSIINLGPFGKVREKAQQITEGMLRAKDNAEKIAESATKMADVIQGSIDAAKQFKEALGGGDQPDDTPKTVEFEFTDEPIMTLRQVLKDILAANGESGADATDDCGTAAGRIAKAIEEEMPGGTHIVIRGAPVAMSRGGGVRVLISDRGSAAILASAGDFADRLRDGAPNAYVTFTQDDLTDSAPRTISEKSTAIVEFDLVDWRQVLEGDPDFSCTFLERLDMGDPIGVLTRVSFVVDGEEVFAVEPK